MRLHNYLPPEPLFHSHMKQFHMLIVIYPLRVLKCDVLVIVGGLRVNEDDDRFTGCLAYLEALISGGLLKW